MIHIIKIKENTGVGYTLNIYQDTINVSYSDINNLSNSHSFSINRDDITSKRNFSSCTLWAIEKETKKPFEIFRNSFSSKIGASELLKSTGKTIYDFFILIPNEEATFDECPIILYESNIPVTSNIPFINEDSKIDIINKLIPKISIIQTDTLKDSLIPLMLQIYDYNDNIHTGTFHIYIESTKGYIPIREFVYTGTSIPFFISPIYLNEKEIITIKAGYKYYSGVTSIDVVVE